ncbi:MAG: NAD(P)-dependent oxidoreductase [Planctomycetes bacterium]|nr:NAD(P)-dependent oxidoreductase [Planctomycetota bacterium]MBI3834768.1 NAD(P)-dependent oxidoreductase [Planctomycetota bacterium]
MKIAVTGATGFLGRYVVHHLASLGHGCRSWYRPKSDRGGFEGLPSPIVWIAGDLDDSRSMNELVRGCDAIVHCALYRPGPRFVGAEGDVAKFVELNMLGTIRLIEAARAAGVKRFIFISTCAVHDNILDDRKLDEAHPMWPFSHYGAHKAAIEKFVHSYGLGHGYEISSLRPTGIYGVARPIEQSKWFNLVQRVARGEPIASDKGGKEVHAEDVAKAVGILLTADGVTGQAYNCYDMYIADQDVAEIAREINGSTSRVEKLNKGPKNQIETAKIQALGMRFGGRALLTDTIRELLKLIQKQ